MGERKDGIVITLIVIDGDKVKNSMSIRGVYNFFNFISGICACLHYTLVDSREKNEKYYC